MLDLDNQYQKMLSFKEEESNKAVAIRKVVTSRSFVVLMISFIIVIVLSLAFMIINSVTDPTFNSNYIASLIINCIAEMLLPLLFLRLLYLTYQVGRGKGKEKYRNSVLDRIFAIRRFAKVFLIILSCCYVISGLTYMNMQAIYDTSPDMFKMYGYAVEDIPALVTMGRYYIYQGIVCGFLAYASLKAFKVMFKSIIIDETENKYVDFWILIGIILAVAVLNVIGCILSSCGIETVLCQGIIDLNKASDAIFLIQNIALSAFMVVGAYIFYLIRKALVENHGSNNPLENKIVYTIKDEDTK